MNKLVLSALLSIVVVFSAPANAAEDNNNTQININESVQIELKPDTFSASVEFREELVSAEQAQKGVNKKVDQAINIIKGTNIKYELGSFSTYKAYKNNKHVARQTVKLESKDLKELEKYATELQSIGNVQRTGAFVSEELIEKSFEKMFNMAYGKAYNRIKFITNRIGGEDFRIVSLNYHVNKNDIMPYRTNALEAAKSDSLNINSSEKKISLNLTLLVEVLPKNPGK